MAANLPDLFLLSVFGKLSAEDRLNASQVCLNWYHRVCEVNQAVQFLTITVGCKSLDDGYFNNTIDQYTHESYPCIKQLLIKEEEMDEAEEMYREKLELSTKWNTLQFSISNQSTGLQLSSNTVQHIISIFPATTELNFIHQLSDRSEYEYLVQILEHTNDQNENNNWNKQLTALRLIEIEGGKVVPSTNERLFTAINRLPVMKRLVIVLKSRVHGLQMQDLPVLAYLKEVRFTQSRYQDLLALLNSVDKYAANNDGLQIDLPYGYSLLRSPHHGPNFLFDHRIHKRIVHIGSFLFDENLPLLGETFLRLSTFTVYGSILEQNASTFAFISQHFHHLRHLTLRINLDFNTASSLREDCTFRTPVVLPSVKALELDMFIIACHTEDGNHRPLNLPAVVPNLRVVHFASYRCLRCSISSWEYESTTSVSSEQTAAFRWCFGAVLQQLYDSFATLPLERITVSVNENHSIISAKELLI